MTFSILLPLWFVLSTLATLSSSRTFCPRIFFQNIDEKTMPYKMIEGVYIKQNYNHNNFPVYRRENGNLLLYHTINASGVNLLIFGFSLKHNFGVAARLFSASDPTTWSSSGSLDTNDVFGGLVQDWLFYNARDQRFSTVPTSSSSPMIKAVCVDDDFRECNSDRVYLNESFDDGRGNVLNDTIQDYFHRKVYFFRNLRPVYEHTRHLWYLQYVDGYWLVTSSINAPSNSVDQAYMRVKDSALRPEYITKTWSVHFRGWRDTPKLRVLCRGVTSLSNTCPSKPCYGNATCVYTSGNETLCLCPYGYTGPRCSINKHCPTILPIVGSELGFSWAGTRPGDLTMSFCSGSYPSVRFSLCVDSLSLYWSRQGVACHKADLKTSTTATPPADQQTINFDDNPAIVPAVLTVAVLLQVLLPFVLWCCACWKVAWKYDREMEDDEKIKEELGSELKIKLQRVSRPKEKDEKEQVIEECQRAVNEYQRENEEKEVSRKRGLLRNASLSRLFSVQLYFSFFLWLSYLVGCDLTHCTQYGMILVHLRRFSIAMLAISPVIVLIESSFSRELNYLKHIMHYEAAWGYIQKLHLIPPKINMVVKCYHLRSRSGSDEPSRVVTYVDQDEFSFGSWIDVSKKELPVESWASLTRLKIDQTILFGDQETEDDFERQKEEMLERNRPRDECVEFSCSEKITGIEKRISAFVDLNMKPFWMRPLFFWIATFLLMSWPYRWLFRAKTAKNYYILKKKMYKSATPPSEEDSINTIIADLVNNTSSSGDCKVSEDALETISLREMSNLGSATCPPLNPAAGPSCPPYPAPGSSYEAGEAVSSIMIQVPNSSAPYPDGSVFRPPYLMVPQPSAPPLVSTHGDPVLLPHTTHPGQ